MQVSQKHKRIKKFLFLLFALTLGLLLTSGCRNSQKAFKGMELYSWQDESDVWQFSILPGTNRNKTIAEVKENPLEIRDVKTKFCQMAKGEQIFWMPQAQDSATGESQPFPPPSEEIITEIETFALDCKVELINLYE